MQSEHLALDVDDWVAKFILDVEATVARQTKNLLPKNESCWLVSDVVGIYPNGSTQGQELSHDCRCCGYILSIMYLCLLFK